MSRYIQADELFHWGDYKLSDAVKYGNKDGKQQDFSYGTLMMYEIADEIDDAPEIETDLPLDRLRELVEADRDGRVVVLPCKPGDTVYMYSGCIFSRYAQGQYTPCEVVNVRYGKRRIVKLYLRPLTENAAGTNYHRIVPASAIGKTVFLTREAAEAAMQKGE